ncbi:flagellar biosynthesis regulator FlaF [Lichenicola sp.]|uniref:flagellar biosynthesis regulator FlaF n=1 Tax=Lichenicola sp. TaxID=2804529 RepID=UPI003AFFE570
MSYGAKQYRRSEGGALSPRETEAAAFEFVNRMLVHGGDPSIRMRALAKNQQLWSMLLKDVGNTTNSLPEILKSDLATVGFWAVRASIAAMGDNRTVETLVQINEDMIAGLRAHHAEPTSAPWAGGLALAG